MRGIRIQAVIALVVLFSLVATRPSVGQQPQPESHLSDRMLDSIPPELFQKMFHSHKLVGSPGLAWKKQRVITVAFYGGSNDLYELIEQTAKEWTALGGQLSFSLKDDAGQYRQWTPSDKSPKANIRIAFQKGGYWSLLGVLAQNVDPGDSTMNFEGFPEHLQKYFHGQNAAEWHISYEHTTILHEFGHAIGLSHEHFNAECQKDLKLDAIISYLIGPPNKWTEEQAKFNMDAHYYAQVLAQQAGPLESKLITSSDTDQFSVMLYVFPVSYYKSGDKSVCKPIGDHGQAWPTALSDGDKQFYLANYRVIPSPFGGASSVKRGTK